MAVFSILDFAAVLLAANVLYVSTMLSYLSSHGLTRYAVYWSFDLPPLLPSARQIPRTPTMDDIAVARSKVRVVREKTCRSRTLA
jgi:hypothetical protein